MTIKRLLPALVLGGLMASLVLFAFDRSPATVDFWSRHETLWWIIVDSNIPATSLLRALGADIVNSPRWIAAGAFFQWSIVGYLLAAIFVKEKPTPSIRYGDRDAK